MQTRLQAQRADGAWDHLKTYPNPLLAYIAACKLSRSEQRRCRTVCASGQVIEEISPAGRPQPGVLTATR
ncbi:MAG: hypothetical protein RLZZ516_986 [Cyanobacteriota bacterium]